MIRILPLNEYWRLEAPIKAKCGPTALVPTPELAPIVAVEEDEKGHIIGILPLQIVFHLEPFISLNHSSFSKLREAIDHALTNNPSIAYYIHLENPEVVPRYEAKGFKPKGILLEGRPLI